MAGQAALEREWDADLAGGLARGHRRRRGAHHFTVEAAGGGPVASQQAGVPFTVKISARDASNNTVTGFDGTVDIGSNRPIAGGPFTTGPFVAGVLSQTITLTQGGLLRTLTAAQTGAGVSGSPMRSPSSPPTAPARSRLPPATCATARPRTRLPSRTRWQPGGISNGALSLEVPAGWPAPSTSAGDPGYVAHEHGHALGGRPHDHRLRAEPQRRPDGRDHLRRQGRAAAPARRRPPRRRPELGGKSRALGSGSLAPLASSPQITVLAPDGSGTIEPSPAFVEQCSAGNTITFTYTAAGPMVNGTLSLDVPTGWSAPSTSLERRRLGHRLAGHGLGRGRTITVSGLTLNGGDT